MKKIGFVSLIGKTNSGKSSLLNSILNCKVAIVSNRKQTTRDVIKGIYNDNESQIVFVDAPGLNESENTFCKILNSKLQKVLKNSNWVFYLIPVNAKIDSDEKQLMLDVLKSKKNAAIITKIDLANNNQIEEKTNELKKIGFKDILFTSVKKINSISYLINFIKKNLTKGQLLFDEDIISDKSIGFMIKEAIRESCIFSLEDELPYSVSIQLNELVERKKNKLFYINATLFVEKESQKKIVIGKEGKKLKSIGISARKKIEILLNAKVFLELKVKVNKNWTKNKEKIKKLGY